MKKNIFRIVIAVVLVLSCAISLFACNDAVIDVNDKNNTKIDDSKKTTTNYDASTLAIYNMDLSGIDGYEDKSVTNGTWAQTYDTIMTYIKSETNESVRYQLMHVAEDILMSTGDILPLYYYTDLFMIKDSVKGFFSSPLGYKYFMYTTVEGKSSLPVCIASEPATIDPALNSSVDGATMCIHAFAGLVKYDKDKNLVADCAKSLPTPTVAENGEATYVFELKDNLKWSDGDALKASDFEFAWKRAASTSLAADYGYMFEIVKGYGGEDSDELLAPLAVTADDEANTLTVTTIIKAPYFFELCAFPAYMPVKKANAALKTVEIVDDEGNPVLDEDGNKTYKTVSINEKWATEPATYIGNGPYKMVSWDHNSVITFEKNPYYHDADSVTMPEVKFYLSDDASNMLANFKNNEWYLIDDVPTAEISTLKTEYPTEFRIEGQLGTYYVCFNNNVDFLPSAWAEKTVAERQAANTEIRNALGLLLDRNYLCTNIAQGGQLPASSFVAKGLSDPSDPEGKEFYQNAGSSEDYIGYYDVSEAALNTNAVKAIKTLKKYFAYDDNTKKFVNFPSFTYLYNTNDGHKAIGEYLQGQWAFYGINMSLQNQEWNTFLETRKAGQYGVARNGWLGDYNDPISFLDMWTTQSGNNDVQFGK